MQFKFDKLQLTISIFNWKIFIKYVLFVIHFIIIQFKFDKLKLTNAFS